MCSVTRTVLAVDVGGTHVKILASGQSEPRRLASGPTLSPEQMVAGVIEAASGWAWEVVSVGVPAVVLGGRVVSDPVHLGKGWAGFDFQAAFAKPTKVVNDAAMQAVGSYEGGKMLFLSLGTGLGSTLIVDGTLEPMELGHLPFRKATFEDYVGERGLQRLGKKRWRRAVAETVSLLSAALEPDYIVLGGGNAAKLSQLPAGARLGGNEHAFTGGFRLWQQPQPARPTTAYAQANDSQGRRREMATYVLLFNWTEQGIKNHKESSGRVDAVREQWASSGIQLKDIYWTLGQYDLVGIVEAADDATLTKALLALGAAGNVRTTTMRAFNQNEFNGLVSM